MIALIGILAIVFVWFVGGCVGLGATFLAAALSDLPGELLVAINGFSSAATASLLSFGLASWASKRPKAVPSSDAGT